MLLQWKKLENRIKRRKSHLFIMGLFTFLDVNLIIINQMHDPHDDQKYQVSLKHFRRVTIHTSN